MLVLTSTFAKQSLSRRHAAWNLGLHQVLSSITEKSPWLRKVLKLAELNAWHDIAYPVVHGSKPHRLMMETVTLGEFKKFSLLELLSTEFTEVDDSNLS